jgi:hypothetical protein
MDMRDTHQPETTAARQATRTEGLLARIAAWFSAPGGDSLSAEEFGLIARDIGVSADELRVLEARGPDAARLMYQRLDALGLDANALDRLAPGLRRESERACSGCADKGPCAHDLAERPDDPRWQAYCPNAATMAAAMVMKGRTPI